MPIYEYQCQQCGEKTEFLQKVSDAPLTKCPHCQQDALQKKVSSTSFQLKGTGWYVTDFRDKSKSTATDKKEPTTEPKTETKPSTDTKSADKVKKKD